jgi:hypothetical protein
MPPASRRARTRGLVRLLAVLASVAPLVLAAPASPGATGFQPGDLFVFSFGRAPGSVSWFRTDGTLVQALDTSLSSVTGAEPDPSGRLWVTSMADNKAVVFDSSGILQGPIVDPFDPDCGEPTDIGFDAQGNAYIGDFGVCIDSTRPFVGPKKFAPDGAFLATLVPQAEADFLDLASDQCTLYWQDANGETIYRRNVCTDGPREFVFSLGLGEPRGMRLLPDGSLLSVENELVVRVVGGVVVQQYDLPGCRWDGLALSRLALSFWSSCIDAAGQRTPHEWSLAAGVVLRTLPGVDGVVGSVYGGFRAARGAIPLAFTGFFAPVENPPTINLMRAGRSVRVPFSLGGDHGLDVLAGATSHQVPCDAAAPRHSVRETFFSRESSLSYDPATDRYTYVFKTWPAWAKRCRNLVLRLRDGTEHTVRFQLK